MASTVTKKKKKETSTHCETSDKITDTANEVSCLLKLKSESDQALSTNLQERYVTTEHVC